MKKHHYSAFHPDYKMMDRPPTPPETLTRAREISIAAGLKYVYTGNVHDSKGGSTYCEGCGKCIIERDWYQLGLYKVMSNYYSCKIENEIYNLRCFFFDNLFYVF